MPELVDILWIIALVLACMGVFLIVTYYPVLYILHKVLSKRLDPLLFKEPYFNQAEQVNYQFFPLYLVKAINYIGLIAWPTFSKKRRFRGLEEKLPIGPVVRILCVFELMLMCIGAVAFLIWMSIVFYVLVFLT